MRGPYKPSLARSVHVHCTPEVLLKVAERAQREVCLRFIPRLSRRPLLLSPTLSHSLLQRSTFTSTHSVSFRSSW